MGSPAAGGDVLGVYIRVLFAWQRRQVRKLGMDAQPHSGALTAIQRFGSALNLNIHFHSLIPDGVFVEEANGEVRLVLLPEPDDEEG